MKETLAESALAYATVATWHAKLTQGRSSCDDQHECGQRQLLSMKQLLKNSTNLSWLIDDCQLLLSLHLMASLLVEYIWSWCRSCRWIRCVQDGCCECYLTFRRQIELKQQQACLTKTRATLFDDLWLQTRPDFITSILKVKCKARSRNVPLCPESFALLSRLAKLWRLYSGMLRELYWLTILRTAAPSQEPIMLIWLEKFGRHWRRRDKESYVTECCFTKTTHHMSSQKLAAIQNAGFELLHHPSNFLILVPSDLYLFSELKEFVKGYRFADDKDVICMADGCLKEQDQHFFYSEIRALEKWGAKCISVAGDYVEKWQNMIYMSCD